MDGAEVIILQATSYRNAISYIQLVTTYIWFLDTDNSQCLSSDSEY